MGLIKSDFDLTNIWGTAHGRSGPPIATARRALPIRAEQIDAVYEIEQAPSTLNRCGWPNARATALHRSIKDSSTHQRADHNRVT